MATPALAAQVRIAAGSFADLDDVMRIMEAAFGTAYGEAWTRSQCAGILPMSGVALTLARRAEAEAPAGFSLVRSVAGESELLLLAVMPHHHRQGIGSRLLDQFVADAREQGTTRVHLEVRDGNPAITMYRDAGFTQAGRRRDYYQGRDGRRFDALTLVREF
jgi:ribosomal-protein-alanine N-acetyltransferase